MEQLKQSSEFRKLPFKPEKDNSYAISWYYNTGRAE